jgi:hypothetical protein
MNSQDCCIGEVEWYVRNAVRLSGSGLIAYRSLLRSWGKCLTEGFGPKPDRKGLFFCS